MPLAGAEFVHVAVLPPHRGLAALGNKALQSAALMSPEWGSANELEIASRPPAVRHSITVYKLRSWLSGARKPPREKALKSRLRVLLSL